MRKPLLAALAVFSITTGLWAQHAGSKSILGTVTGFKVNSKVAEILLKPDSGGASAVRFSPDTEVVRVAPGEHDLSKAEPARITEILTGDRVLVSFVQGMPEARRIVLIAAADIAKRNEAYRQDWREHGVSGTVASVNGNQIVLRSGPDTINVTVPNGATLRRYPPDSVSFTDAKFAAIEQVSPGDQLQARGEKSADSRSIAAQEIVFGTFLTTAARITSVDRAANTVIAENLQTKKPLTVKLTGDSQLKAMPDMQEIMHRMHGGGGGASQPVQPPARPDMRKMLEQLPPATVDDLKPGGLIVVTSTKGERSDEVTAITLIANADFVVQMMQVAAGGQPAPSMPNMEQVVRAHGITAGSGFTLPAILP